MAEVPLGEVTLQAALEAAWDGDFVLCYKRARTAVSIANDDLETMELTMRCAAAARVLPDAVAWVRSAYSLKLNAPIARYGLGIATLLRGELGESRKLLEKLALEVPVAGYQAAVAAQIDDDVLAAEKSIAAYVKANPSDPAGRLLQTEIVCALDLAKCAAILETVRSTDDDEPAIARRLGAAIAGPISASRSRLFVLSKDAEAINSAAFSDAYALATVLREGSDPATILVRSPRSGRPEPAPGVDLVKQARPIARVPFATRVIQLAALGDPAAVTMHARMIALFPTELGTWRLAKRSDKTATAARKELEKSAPVKWRASVAALLARADEACDLSTSFPWTDRGPLATSVRARCELSLEPARGRKIADARLAVLPFGQLDGETAIEGEAAVKDSAALEELAHKIAKVAPTSSLVATALWASADSGAKKPHLLYGEAIAQVSYDPHFTRKLLQKYVDQHDIPRAKLILAQALVESPFDAFLCGVQGEILLNESKADAALPWLTKACVSARARKESDVLPPVLASLGSAIGKTKGSKDKAVRDAAQKCAKGE
ncbi:MAG: hypothetical protein ACXVEF_08315 [Polyangiales bacterium]